MSTLNCNGDDDFTDANELQLVDDFVDTNSFGVLEPEHDASGNLTFDGHLKYTYDAFNRLTQAQKAYRDSGGTVQVGSTIAEYQYDGQHRRISREITNSGQLDAVYHYYCAGASVVEEHVGTSATVIKQHVWGLTYIDELIETTVDGTSYYAVLDTKYCVLALLESDGDIKERYEYTPQGERQVFITSGANDPKAQTPMTQAPRAGTAKAYALCNIGFQGLMHDEVTGNIYQRAREYSPRLARFLQRDPWGYPDGPNTYAAYHVLYGGVDPSGMNWYWDLVVEGVTGESPSQRTSRKRREAQQRERERREREQRRRENGGGYNSRLQQAYQDTGCAPMRDVNRAVNSSRESQMHAVVAGQFAQDVAVNTVKEGAIELATGPVPSGLIRAARHGDELVDAGRAIANVVDEGGSATRTAQTGARMGDNIPSADTAYDAIRASQEDVARIAENTGIKPENIQKVKDHLFNNKHLLDRHADLGCPPELARFDSDQAIADAWRRLEDGSHTADDMALLRHEAAEANVMRRTGDPSYNNAHNRAQESYPAPDLDE